jgi:hypothetical protein
MTESREPSVGQFWRSLDPRDLARNRRVKIVEVRDDFVFVQSFLAGRNGRMSRIHRGRFDGVQFELITR